MSIRITGGVYGGRVLREAIGPGVRPTSARVREALFSIVGQDLEGVRVLDAFGGAGLVALEARSRGARVTVIERNPKIAAEIRRRAQSLGADLELRVGDILRLAPRLEPYDGVFADPPYEMDPLGVIQALGPLARDWLVLETDARSQAPEQAGELPLDRVRQYGRTLLWIYRRASPHDSSGSPG